MSEPVSIEDIKRHLVLESEEAGDDAYLESMIVGARAACERRIRRLVADLEDDELHMLKHAIRMIVAHWFANRETAVTGTIATQLPLSATWLLEPLVSYAIDPPTE